MNEYDLTINNLCNSLDNCNILTSKDIVDRAIYIDLETLVPYYITRNEPKILYNKNEYYKHPLFDINIFINILKYDYQNILKVFLNLIKEVNNNPVCMIDVESYIDYYIEMILNWHL
jgi:hypothetical protein